MEKIPEGVTKNAQKKQSETIRGETTDIGTMGGLVATFVSFRLIEASKEQKRAQTGRSGDFIVTFTLLSPFEASKTKAVRILAQCFEPRSRPSDDCLFSELRHQHHLKQLGIQARM